MKRFLIPCAVALFAVSCTNLHRSQEDWRSLAPPVAEKRMHVTEIHGRRLVDNYHWLRNKEDPRVIEYLKAENAYTDAVMKPMAKLQKSLYTEFLSRIQQTDEDVPVRRGKWLYYTRVVEGMQYPLYCRKLNEAATEEVLLDVNTLAEGKAYMDVGVFEVSEDGNLLAYSTDETGFREYTLHVRDLSSGQERDFKATNVLAAVWANDNRTLFYVTADQAKRPSRVFRHALDGPAELVYEETDRKFNLWVSKTRSKKFIVLTSGSFNSSEARVMDANRPDQPPRIIAPRKPDIEYYVDHHSDRFLIYTNDAGKNFRIVSAPIDQPAPGNWTEFVGHRNETFLEGFEVFQDHIVLQERHDANPRLVVLNLLTTSAKTIPVQDEIGVISPDANPELDAPTFRYTYESPLTPSSVMEYNFATGETKLLKQQRVLGGWDRSKYELKRVFATASDGTRIPISMVYRKGATDRPAPLLLEAYGAYGAPSWCYFSSTSFSLLDRGVIYAIAHIRGGGEMGKAWHEQGHMLNKKNTFTDFIACAEHLQRKGFTTPDKTAIIGWSAGGLTMGGVITRRPDLCKVAVLGVPFVDVLNTMLDDTLPLTTQEYLEWGNPNEKQYFDYMRGYSPYDNIRPTRYPNMLVLTSLNDSAVLYHEPAKFTAKMREFMSRDRLLLFRCNMDAGHGGSSGRYDALEEMAFLNAFILWQLGITQ
jgi:oligopeptidase B